MKPKVIKVTYRQMWDFLQTLDDDQEINIDKIDNCLVCRTVRHVHGISSVTATDDYAERQEYNCFSTFKSIDDDEENLYVAPDGFVIWSIPNAATNPWYTVAELKSIIKKLAKKNFD